MLRRDLFAMTAAAAAGAAFAPSRRLLAQSGRPPLEAREGELRITGLEVYTAGRLYLRVTTDSGIEGWGEVGVYPARIAEAVVETYRPLLLGMSATRVEHIWQMLYRAHRNVRGGILHVGAIGGIDVALWDILGKAANLPLYTLLGGPCRHSIRRYPGPRAFKETTHRLSPMVETPAAVESAVRALEKRRDSLGPGGWLMFDGHGKFTAQAAIQFAKRIEPLGLAFFEEVVPPEQNADLARVKRATTVPLAAGERMATIWPFREILEAQTVDVLNPDLIELGGVSQMRKLAAIAELYDVPLAPHSTHSAIGLAASLHVAASINNFLIHEAYEQIAARTPWITGLAWPEGDAFGLPGGPGLGVKVNMDGLKDAVAKARQKGARGIEKAYFTDDGAVADR